jgi:GMP synthase-like glutamine amidotransferase
MKPVAIFRHARTEGAGFLSDYFDESGIAWQLFRLDERESVPASSSPFSGLVFMGGPMSVNDDLPWIPLVLDLIRDAVSKDIPVLGHCLGGQLMAKAMGARVGRNEAREIGWGRVDVIDQKDEWFGGLDSFMVFHWHGETFDIPEGAKRLLCSRWCDNQAFSLGPHLALQCHVEMKGEMVRQWCETGKEEILEHLGQSVQSAVEMQLELEDRIAALNGIARKIYGAWVRNLVI